VQKPWSEFEARREVGLLFLQREPRRSLQPITRVALAQICAEPAMCLGWNVFRALAVGSDVEQ